MTSLEYIQLKAFARQDGALLSLWWIGGFACYIQGMSHPTLGMVAVLIIVSSPFFVANRLRHFRDDVRDGVISFSRGYTYTVMTFFYGGVLLAAACYVYFAFIDQGFLVGKLSTVINSEEGRKVMELYGLGNQMNESMKELTSMRPIDYALNLLAVNISFGFFFGLPIAVLMQRQTAKAGNQ